MVQAVWLTFKDKESCRQIFGCSDLTQPGLHKKGNFCEGLKVLVAVSSYQPQCAFRASDEVGDLTVCGGVRVTIGLASLAGKVAVSAGDDAGEGGSCPPVPRSICLPFTVVEENLV